MHPPAIRQHECTAPAVLPSPFHLQAYISSLHYNHTAANYFSVSKRRPYCLLMHTAKDMVKDALPIKCVEAVFLALLLTSSWHDLHRVPLGFKTRVGRRVYRYIFWGGACCSPAAGTTSTGCCSTSGCRCMARTQSERPVLANR